MMKRTHYDKIGWTLALAIAALFATANLFDLRPLWGINFYTFLPPVWTYVALTVIFVVSWPPVTARLLAHGERLSILMADDRRTRWTALAGAALVLGALCWIFSERLPLLGDGGLRAREIFDGKSWQPTEIGDFFLHALVYKGIIKPLGLQVTETYRYVSVLSGIAFIIGTFRLCAYLSRPRSTLWMVAGLSTGCTVLFFGYVESYSIVAALIPWVILTGIKAVDRTGSITAFGLFVLGTGIIHSVAFILFGPALLLIGCTRSDRCVQWTRTHRTWLTIGLIVCAALLVAGKAMGWPLVSQFVLPLFASAAEPTALFTRLWVANIFNWILLSGMAIIALFLGVVARSKDDETNNRPVFALTVIAPSLLFLLLFVPKLGGPIDWDLFALPLAAVTFSLIPLAEPPKSGAIVAGLVPLLAVAVVNFAGFIAVNASTTISAERFSRIIPMTGSTNPWTHWASLVEHAEHHPELYARRNEFLMNSWQSPPNNKRDSAFTLLKLMRVYIMAGDSVSARAVVQTLKNVDSLSPGILAAEADVFARFGSAEEQLAFAQMLESRFPQDPIALGTAGVTYMKLGLRDRCGPLLMRSYAADNHNALTALNYGVFLATDHRYADALPVLKNALSLDKGSFLAAFYLATIYLALGDINNAKAASLRAEANAFRPEEQERIKQLRTRF
jgi:Flp pilus assembly protein TadD